MDLCFRLKQLGYKSVLVPTSTFKHLESATVKANPLIKQELMISRLYIYRKNYSYLKYKCLQFIILLKLALKALTSKNRAKLFWIVFQGAPLKYSLKQKQQIVLK
jgi:GT2 family glycosyltransferase